MMGYYDKHGRPISAERYGELRWDDTGKVSNYARVGLDTVDGVEVSTVWLGLDHSFNSRLPIIFESMIFGGEHDGDINRYSSEGAALIGHRCAVNNLRRGRAPW